MEPPDEAALLKSMLTSAEQVLSAAWSGPVRLARDPRGSSLNGSEIRLDGSARAHSRVMRCSVLASPQPAPATVIVKSFQECAWKDWKGAYDPNDAQQGRTALHLDAFATMTEELRHLEVLGGLARALASRLRTLWAFVPELPLYPVFRCRGEQN
jgi:hypothetical protein